MDEFSPTVINIYQYTVETKFRTGADAAGMD